jgi:TolA-binding protein
VTGQYDQYLAASRQFIETHPDSPLSITIQYQIGEQYFQQEEFAEAIPAYQWIVAHFPNNEYADNALYRIGECYMQMENFVSAAHTFQNLFDAYSESEFRSAALFELANAHFKLLEYETAIQEYQTFIRSFADESTLPQAMLNYEICLLRLDRFPEAQAIFKQLFKKFPASPQTGQAGLLIGDLLVAQQQCEDAAQAYSPVISGDDQVQAAQARVGIAKCYENRSDFERAVSEYLKVIYVYADQKDLVERATYSAATLYEQLKRIEEARNLYQKLADSAKDRTLAEQAKRKLQELR